MEKQFKIGVNCFLVKDNKILLGKRLCKAGYGEWGLPGGHLEYGEDFIVGAKRELYEETGVKALEIEFNQLINDLQENGHFIHINFLVTKWEGEIETKEPEKCAGWEWFDLDNLPTPIFYGHDNFIPAFKKGIHFIS